MEKINATQVKSEIIGMDVRIGVVEHSLLQVSTFKARTHRKFSLKSQPGLFVIMINISGPDERPRVEAEASYSSSERG